MKYDELKQALLAVCPHGEMGIDNDFQLVFYTGLQFKDTKTVEPFDSDSPAV